MSNYRGAGGRELGNLSRDVWVLYQDLDLAGPTGAYDRMTLKYAAPLPKHRPWLVIDVLHRPTVVTPSGEDGQLVLSRLEGGTVLGRFICQATSGWQDYVDISLPIALPDAEPGDIALRIVDGKANLLTLTLGTFADQAKRQEAQTRQQEVEAAYKSWVNRSGKKPASKSEATAETRP